MLNAYALIILVALLIEYVLSAIADVLNTRALDAPLPKEFEGVYNPEKYQRSQEYTRTRTLFGRVQSTFGLVVLLAFWFSGGFNWLDQIVRAWNLGTFVPLELATGIAFIGILVAAHSILALPFRIYSTFVIEERFGFNRTTPRTFVMDILKGLLLGIVLGVPLLLGVLAIFEYAGPYSWVYGWIAVTLFTLVVQFIAPTWIMPLFNKFTPLPDGELRSAILAYAERVRFPLEGVYVIDGSKRSRKSNAFFTGFGKHKRIALFDTLVSQHTVPELVAVLAHEIGHYKQKHIVQGLIITILHTGLVFFLLSIFLTHRGLFDAFGMEEMSVYAGLVFFGLLYTPIELIVGVALQIVSRKHEYEADRYAADTTNQPEEMIAALKKLSSDNLSHLTPHPFYVQLHYSHPPILERIRALSQRAE
jgi:STE24 endopeptidase